MESISCVKGVRISAPSAKRMTEKLDPGREFMIL